MNISIPSPDMRVADVRFSADTLIVTLRDGQTIHSPLSRFPRLQCASEAERKKWEPAAAGHGIHWPTLDEDLSVDGLLRGEHVPHAAR